MTSNSSSNPRSSVTMLSDLLEFLYPEPGPDILTLDDFRSRYRLTGLSPLSVAAIQQIQRINRNSGRFDEIGLCEFHIGLIYLDKGDCQGAIHQFREARIQWSFIDKIPAVCLAYIAEGLTQHERFAYETALSLFGKVENCQKRINFEPSSINWNEFAVTLDEVLKSAQKEARDALNRLTQLSETTNPPQDLPICDDCIWFRVEKANTDFLPSINQGDWLIVSKNIVGHKYSKEDMIVIIKPTAEDECIVLHPLIATQPFARIHLLVRPGFSGQISIDDAKVVLSQNDLPLTIQPDEIEGIVVGWHEAT